MRTRKIFTLLVLLALVSAGIPAVLAEEEQQLDEGIILYNRASQSLNTGDYAAALVLLDQALALNTSEFISSGARNYALLDKSKVQIELNDLTGALATIDQALALEETDKLWNNKGYVLYRLGRYAEAVTAYNTAIKITPDYTVALINKGDALMVLADHQGAIDAYTRAMVSDADDNDLTLTQKAITYRDMGDAHMALGQYREAASAYQSSLVNNPDNAEVKERLSLAQQKADSASQMTIVTVIAVVVIGCAAAWFILKRMNKPAGEKSGKDAPVKKKPGK
jgi:superkiller protein 3